MHPGVKCKNVSRPDSITAIGREMIGKPNEAPE